MYLRWYFSWDSPLKLVLIILFFSLISTCATKKRKKRHGTDFSLDSSISENRIAEENYYDELEKTTSTIKFHSSFPAMLSIAKAVDNFPQIPSIAFQRNPSWVSVNLGSCRIFIRSGNTQVQRYLFSQGFVKFGAELIAKRYTQQSPGTELNVRMRSQLHIVIDKGKHMYCKRLLYGRRTYIGHFHLFESSAALLPSPKTQPSPFQVIRAEGKGEKVFIHWNKSHRNPVLRNELDFPAIAETHYYRARMPSRGFYYFSFAPILKSSLSRSNVINIPLKSSYQHKKKHSK